MTEDFEFQPADIDVKGTTISVHVTNRVDTRHTLTIDELEVDLNLPPHTSQRVSFEADLGTYRFFCSPHDPSMEGELTVR